MLQSEGHDRKSHHTERFVQSALDALSAHIAILDEHGVIIGVNTAWRRFAEENQLLTQDFGIGTNYLRVCDDASGRNSREAGVVAAGIREVMNYKREEFYIEYPCHSPTKRRWFMMHVTRFDWESRPRFIVAHQNVTEVKRVQFELFESKQRIEAILNNVQNGIITVDERGRIESVNPAAADIFGFTMLEMIGVSISNLMAEPKRSTALRYLLTTLQSQPNGEYIGQRRDGTLFPMHFALSRVQLGHRSIYTGILQDITERKRMEAELIEKEKISVALEKERELRELKNRFISMMSHELRTPLASILLSADMLRNYGDQAPPEEKLLYFNNIRVQVDHLTELIRDVLTISKGDAHRIEFTPEALDLLEYCRKIISEFHLTYRQTHTLKFETSQKKLRTMIDPRLMRQALTNLLANAIKYSPEGGRVWLRVKQDTKDVIIQVVDEGMGIPPEDQPRLFEPFYRGANVESLPGTGLGLAITRQAIDIHSGTLHVESQIGKGTTITVRFPRILGDQELQ
jgi:PAS domain S-box-containing protein